MSEGPRSRWRWLQFRLLTLLGILASVGVAVGMIDAKRGELAWCIALPFAAGLAIGDIVPKRNRFEPAPIVIAPFFSPVALGIIVVAATTYGAVVAPNLNVTAPYIVQGISGAVFIVPGIFIYGAIPSIVGASISSSLKKPYIFGSS